MLSEWQVLDNNNGEMMSKMSESDDVTVNSDRRDWSVQGLFYVWSESYCLMLLIYECQ